MKTSSLFITVSIFLSSGCEMTNKIGDPCMDDNDCGVGFCLDKLGDGDDAGVIEFTNGMCTDSCEEIGGFVGFEICLEYFPTGETFLFNTCRNDGDCRTDDSYYCTYLGISSNPKGVYVGLNACLPLDASQQSLEEKSMSFGLVEEIY